MSETELQTASTLLDLPPNLIERIIVCLDDEDDIVNAVCSCRVLRQAEERLADPEIEAQKLLAAANGSATDALLWIYLINDGKDHNCRTGPACARLARALQAKGASLLGAVSRRLRHLRGRWFDGAASRRHMHVLQLLLSQGQLSKAAGACAAAARAGSAHLMRALLQAGAPLPAVDFLPGAVEQQQAEVVALGLAHCSARDLKPDSVAALLGRACGLQGEARVAMINTILVASWPRLTSDGRWRVASAALAGLQGEEGEQRAVWGWVLQQPDGPDMCLRWAVEAGWEEEAVELLEGGAASPAVFDAKAFECAIETAQLRPVRAMVRLCGPLVSEQQQWQEGSQQQGEQGGQAMQYKPRSVGRRLTVEQLNWNLLGAIRLQADCGLDMVRCLLDAGASPAGCPLCLQYAVMADLMPCCQQRADAARHPGAAPGALHPGPCPGPHAFARVRLLLARGAPAQDKDAILTAATRGAMDGVQLLLDAGAVADGQVCMDMLYSASAGGQVAAVEWLLPRLQAAQGAGGVPPHTVPLLRAALAGAEALRAELRVWGLWEEELPGWLPGVSPFPYPFLQRVGHILGCAVLTLVLRQP